MTDRSVLGEDVEATAQKRNRILDAAFEVFTEKGFHRATVAEVAEKAHVGKGTVYLHFAGKEALLLAIFDALIDRLLGALDRALSESADPQQGVKEWVARQLGETRAGRLIALLLAQRPFLSGLSSHKCQASWLSGAVERIAARIQAAVDCGTLRPVDPTLTACLLLSLPAAAPFYGIARSGTSLAEAMPRFAEGTVDILWFGLRRETKA
jgi:AcrR family transcriptional regulator